LLIINYKYNNLLNITLIFIITVKLLENYLSYINNYILKNCTIIPEIKIITIIILTTLKNFENFDSDLNL